MSANAKTVHLSTGQAQRKPLDSLTQYTSKLVYITPDMAREYLKTSPGNRKLQPDTVARYAEMMKAGQWYVSSPGIGFNEAGQLRNGHHRLEAVIKAGVPILMRVTVDDDRGFVFTDLHQIRKIYDCINFSDPTKLADGFYTKNTVAVINILIDVYGNQAKSLAKNPKYVDKVGEVYRHEIMLGEHAFHGNSKPFGQASLRAAIAVAAQYEPEKKLLVFADALRLGPNYKGTPDNKAPFLLRDSLLRTDKLSGGGRQPRIRAFLQTMYMIKAYCEGREVRRIPTCERKENGAFAGFDTPVYEMEMPSP